MYDVNEITVLQEGPVKITNLRMLIGTETYKLSNITSAKSTKQAKSKRPFLFVIVGVLLVFWSISDQTRSFGEFFNIGIVLIVASVVFFLLSKTVYTVQIEGASGKCNILKATDLSFVKRIVDAVSSVMVRQQNV
jgi:predicted membrane channel-forming protein YqfA (hemolysin III family)